MTKEFNITCPHWMEPNNPVVLEGIHADMTRPNVRFSFSRYTTKEEIDYALQQLQQVYQHNLS